MTTDKRPLKVFLCHAHADRDPVRALYARLRREGVDVWLDKEKLLPGADWELEIRKAVREADVVVVCLSKQFNQAGFRQKEVRIALDEADKQPPGEAEWEKAARGTDGRTYPWGDIFNGAKLNSCDKNCPFNWADKNVDDGYGDTAPVGSYENGKSPYGLYDMAGNVWEWVADWYSDTYYSQSPSRNPQGPSSGDVRVVRGGAWYGNQSVLRASDRGGFEPDSWIGSVGFRCVRSP